MAQEAVGMNAAGAAALVGAIGIVNGLGRLAWSTLSDWMGRAVLDKADACGTAEAVYSAHHY